MTDFLAQGDDLLRRVRHEHATRQVVYRRGDRERTVWATVGQTNFRLNDQAGGTIRYRSRDYLIATDDLAEAGFGREPQRHDQVIESIDGVKRVHEVLGPGNDEPDWRWSGLDGKTLRIHTQYWKAET
ncbi:MAG: hypothetical protein GVY28_12530 [Alphaproteobacteria bacterium]|jgi:hypothetical protein|nr:hypothetical protein [Alphaproteobacteria bacterium]